jgi:hypothetical protein
MAKGSPRDVYCTLPTTIMHVYEVVTMYAAKFHILTYHFKKRVFLKILVSSTPGTLQILGDKSQHPKIYLLPAIDVHNWGDNNPSPQITY